VHPHAALADGILETLVRPGAEAVERYGDLRRHPAHRLELIIPDEQDDDDYNNDESHQYHGRAERQ
jgi:hypothetical protein